MNFFLIRCLKINHSKAFKLLEIYFMNQLLKYLTQIADPILLPSIFRNVANLGAIHPISSFDSTF